MFEKLKLPTIAEVYAGPLHAPGNWVVANVGTQFSWPLSRCTVSFLQRSFILIPPAVGEKELVTFPAVAIRLAPGESINDGKILILQLLSSLSWASGLGIWVEQWGGGVRPYPTGGFKGPFLVAKDFYQPYLPEALDRDQRLALAFYREGLSLRQPAYACLSLFKVLNIFNRTGGQLKRWITAHADLLSDRHAKQRIEQIRAAGDDLAQYLWASNRCAVAHAGEDPTIDPEDPRDQQRLQDDLPLVQSLAAYAIEAHFGIQTRSTVWREHLYELAGFKRILGTDLVASILENGGLPEHDWPLLPRMNIGLHGAEHYPPLQNMTAKIVLAEQGALEILCVSANGLTEMVLRLDFAEERLHCDVFDALRTRDDGTATAAKDAASVHTFRRDYVMNGILQAHNAEDGVLLGRCDAFIPVNLDLGATNQAMSDDIAKLEAERGNRMDRSQRLLQLRS